MEINKNIFRTYDIRGVVPTEIDENVATLIGRGFATLMSKEGEKTIIVGHDVRLTSESLTNALIEGIISTGMNVIDIGICVTPMTYFAREYLKIKPSIMVTASHNPKEYNGFKICGLGTDTIFGDEIQALREFIEKGEFIVSENKGTVEKKSLKNAYINDILNKVKLGDRKLKVAIDCGSGAGSLFAEELFRKLGVEVLPVCCEPDGNFPIHHPDPSQEKNMLEFEKFIVDNKCDVGLGFDGDADRVIAFDENGKIYYGDEFAIIIWIDLMPKHPGSKVLMDVKCSQSLYDEGIIYGQPSIEYEFTRIYAHALITGQSKNPEKVYDAFKHEVNKFKQESINKENFERIKKMIYGGYIKEYNEVADVARMFLADYFKGINSFDYLEEIEGITVEYLEQILKDVFKEEKMVLSIVKN